MVLYAASTFLKHPQITINNAATVTAVTGAMGMKSKTIAATIANIMTAAKGAL